MYTAQIEKAIQAASVLHEGQLRKGSVPIPYVSHVFSVFLIASDYTDDESTVVAALLHDTLEDTSYTAEALEADFGPVVRQLVAAVTENTVITNWYERKMQYINQVANAGPAACLIAAADKIHNMRSIIETYYDDIPGYLSDFSHYLDVGVDFLTTLGEVLRKNCKNPICDEYQQVLQEFIAFNNYVKETRNEK